MGRWQSINFSPDAGGASGQTSTDSSKAGDQTGASIKSQDKGDQSQTTTAGAGDSSAESDAGQTASSDSVEDFKAKYENLLTVHTEMKAKEEARKKKALEEQGKYQELYQTSKAEVDTLKPQLEATEAVLKKILDTEMKAIPENLQKLVLGDTSVKKLESIALLRETGVLNTSTARGDGSPPPGGQATVSFEDIYNA